jgi:hypothetical protein
MKTFLTTCVILLSFANHAAVADTSASHKQAATDLIDLMGLERQMMGGAAAMVDAMSSQNPSLAPYRDVILEWSESIMTWDAFGPKMIDIYTEAFSENELRDLIVFYKTPTGQKAIKLMPELVQKGAQLGAQEAQAHIPRLQQMIEARKAELDAEQTGN